MIRQSYTSLCTHKMTIHVCSTGFHNSGNSITSIPDFTGSPEETGEGAGRGYNINFPLPKGTGDGEYCTALRLATSRITDYNATYIVIR